MTEAEIIRTIRLSRRLAACFSWTEPKELTYTEVAERYRAAYPALAAVYENHWGFCHQAGVPTERIENLVYQAINGKDREPAGANLRGLTFDFSKLISAVLHVGFLTVEETEEQLGRLGPPGPTYDDGDPPVARSRIVRTNEVIRPIDRVAARVAPPPEEHQR